MHVIQLRRNPPFNSHIHHHMRLFLSAPYMNDLQIIPNSTPLLFSPPNADEHSHASTPISRASWRFQPYHGPGQTSRGQFPGLVVCFCGDVAGMLGLDVVDGEEDVAAARAVARRFVIGGW